MNKLGLIATIVPLVIVAIGLIGWVLTLRNDVTGTAGQLDGVHEEISGIHERIDDEFKIVMERLDESQERITELEKSLAIADDQMQTIMGEHEVIGEMFKEIGEIQPAGERRTYGGYGN